MPGLLDLYEETHTRSDKTPITQKAQETMVSSIILLENKCATSIKTHCIFDFLFICIFYGFKYVNCCCSQIEFMLTKHFFPSLQNEIKQLLEQRKTGETKMTDEEIYAKVKPKRKISARDRGKGISPSLTTLFGSFREGEKLRKEVEEAKKEAIEANEKNKILSNELESAKKETRIMERALERFLELAGLDGYKVSDLIMDEVYRFN